MRLDRMLSFPHRLVGERDTSVGLLAVLERTWCGMNTGNNLVGHLQSKRHPAEFLAQAKARLDDRVIATLGAFEGTGEVVTGAVQQAVWETAEKIIKESFRNGRRAGYAAAMKQHGRHA